MADVTVKNTDKDWAVRPIGNAIGVSIAKISDNNNDLQRKFSMKNRKNAVSMIIISDIANAHK